MKLPIELKDINSPNSSIFEEHGFFQRDGKHLFYASFMPVKKASVGVILCGPLAEERVRTVRIYVSFARVLASLGMGAIYFDYFGDGDSEGNFEEASFNDRLMDIKGAFQFFKEKFALNEMGLQGLRWGGTLAALTADDLRPDFLILWEPVVDTGKYFFDHLRAHIASQMIIEGKILKNREELLKELEAGKVLTVEGYNLTGDFYFKARDCGLKDRKFDFKGKSLIIQIAPNPERIRPELLGLQQTIPGSEIAAVPREFEWEKTETWQPAPPQLFTKSLDFLEKNGFFGRNI
jgi:alpha/beta superfamily hydrolase